MKLSAAPQPALFSPLPKARTPWSEFVFSSGAQAILVAFVIWMRILHPEIVRAPEHTFRSVQLVAVPPPVSHRAQPHVPAPTFTAKLDSPTALRLPAPEPKPAVKVESAPAPVVSMTPKKMETFAAAPAPVVPRAVRTNLFSPGSSATPTLAKASEKVQTGGFGDPNAIPAQGNPGKAVNVAALGSFDLPSGPGSGNGSGGANGLRGVVGSSGFGNGVATARSNSRRANAVLSSGFGDADVPAAPTAQAHASSTLAPVVPAEIISKPVPVYTQDAKNLRIEGEVLVEVVLRASGDLQVKRIVRGLGHGLDDSAVKAAEQIRFKPATKNGQPADSTVVLHIIFQLA